MKKLAQLFDEQRNSIENILRLKELTTWNDEIYPIIRDKVLIQYFQQSDLEKNSKSLENSLQDLFKSDLKKNIQLLLFQIGNPSISERWFPTFRKFFGIKKTINDEFIEQFLKNISESLKNLDRILYNSNQPIIIQKISNTLEEEQDLLSFLQTLLYFHQKKDANNALEKLEELENLLGDHGIICMTYNGDNIEYFELFPDPSGKLSQPITKQLALLKDNKLLLKGRVIKPNN